MRARRRRTQRIFAVRNPNSLIALVDRPEAAEAGRMCRRVVVRTVIVVQRLRFLHLPHPDVVLHRLLQLLLLHVVLELLMKAVQPMDEFILARMDDAMLRTQVRLVHVLTAQELAVLAGEVAVVLLTADRVVVGVDLDVLQALTAQRDLMLVHVRRALKGEVRRRRRFRFVMEIVVEATVGVPAGTRHVTVVG